jgi:hypothetical protein
MRLAACAFALLSLPLFCQAPAQKALPKGSLLLPPESRNVLPVAENVTFLAEDSLPYDPNLNGPGHAKQIADQDALEIGDRGLRQYQFVLLPKETIKFRLQGVPPGKMMFLLAVPPKGGQDPLFPQIRRVNRMPPQSRQSRLEFENPTSEPYTIVLLLIGRVDLPYRINLERAGGIHPASSASVAK